MIASSLKDEDGLVNLLISKGADVNMKTNNGQVSNLHFRFHLFFLVST